ncbi:MAG: hypothetical protein AAGK02_03195 [Pseudomonadota bacterium]
MLGAQRRTAFAPDFLARVGIAWLGVSALLLIVNFTAIAGLRFPDPDDVLRLVQVRDLIAGQSWFDLTQYRVDTANGGVPMHWSRLVDVPLLIVIVALTPLLGAATAELVAVVLVPLITLGLAMLLAARIAWRLMGEDETTMTCLVMAVSIPLLFQLGPMRIDHHGWQIVGALAVMNGLMARTPHVGGWVIGTAMAVWLSISIEGLPLAAVICGVLALRWIRNRHDRAWLVVTMQALATTSVVLFLATRGVGDLATYCDAISPTHVGIFVLGAVVFTGLSAAEPLPRPAIWLGFALAGGGGLAMMMVAAPQCAAGGFADLDPLVDTIWHDQVMEGMPIWKQPVSSILHYAVAPVIGLLAALNLASRSSDWLKGWWTEYAIVLGAAILISLLVARAGAVACALAAAPLAWQIRQWLRTIRSMNHIAPRMLATIGVAMALLPALPIMLLGWAIPAQASLESGASVAPAAAAPKSSSCDVASSAAVLRALPVGEMYAPMDIAPGILLETRHTVVATGHHRGHEGMRVLIETALADSAVARQTLTDRGSDYVALCGDLGEPRMYAKLAPDGFVAQLIRGDVPDWLEPVDTGPESNLAVWRVVRN